VRRLLHACRQTFEGRRNRALIALLADSGLRISEALRLRIENVNFSTRTLEVRGGKGGKDGVGFFGAESAQLLRAWLGARREVIPEDFLFADRWGRCLTRHHAAHILYRPARRAALTRKIGPHALRHCAATSILKQMTALIVDRSFRLASSPSPAVASPNRLTICRSSSSLSTSSVFAIRDRGSVGIRMYKPKSF
jgi:site-specific recombinase XerD